jgi:cleavage stimulation factor subunit 2
MSNSSCVLYVGAIPYNWDVEIIKSVVCGSGPIVDVRCMMDNASKNKGFCFVEYLTPLDALNALTILSKIKIEGRKKLRIELSKEGLRNSQHLSKPTLKLNRLLLPANVILPLEMKNAPENVGDIDDDTDLNVNNLNDDKSYIRNLKNSIRENNDIKLMVSQMLANGMDLHQTANLIIQFKAKNENQPFNLQQQIPSSSSSNNSNQQQIQNQSTQLMSIANLNNIANNNQNNLLNNNNNNNNNTNTTHTTTNTNNINPINASTYMPQPTSTMQSAMLSLQPNVDPVSKTLSTIPPGVLIELLAKLKLVLSTPNPSSNTYTEAASILNENPKLAVAAAQALLLMGVVDLDVLAQAQQHHHQQQQQQQQQQNQPIQQQQQSIQQQQPVSIPHPPVSNIANSTQIVTEWLSLPQHTVAKLLQLNRNEANLIFQVLQLSPDQIAVLPPSERNMANQIRGQYL